MLWIKEWCIWDIWDYFWYFNVLVIQLFNLLFNKVNKDTLLTINIFFCASELRFANADGVGYISALHFTGVKIQAHILEVM